MSSSSRICWDFNIHYTPKGVRGFVQSASQLGLRGMAVNFEVEEGHEAQELIDILEEEASGRGASNISTFSWYKPDCTSLNKCT